MDRRSGNVVAGVPPFPGAGEAYHPPSLRLLLVQFVHRHGERTPLLKDKSGFVGSREGADYSRDCLAGVRLALQQQAGTVAHYRQSLSDPTESGLMGTRASPLTAFPSTIGSCTSGQLTDTGRNTLVGIGRHFRRLYVDYAQFLPPTWVDPESVYLRSTQFPRTIESLHSFLEGLYPLSARTGAAATEPPVLHLRAVPFKDNILMPFKCARLSALRKEFERTALANLHRGAAQSWPAHIRDILGEPNAAGEEATSFLYRTVDNVAGALAHGKPVEIAQKDFTLLSNAMAHAWFGSMQTGGSGGPATDTVPAPASSSMHDAQPSPNTVRQMMIGRFAHELMELTEDAVAHSHTERGTRAPPRLTSPYYSSHRQSTRVPQLAVYSCHDATIAPLLGGLGLWRGHWPPFASHVTFELYANAVVAAQQPQTTTTTTTARGWFGRVHGNNDDAEAAGVGAANSAHYVRVKYNEAAEQLPGCAKRGNHFPGDPTLCTYAAFAQVMHEFIVTEEKHRELCNGSSVKGKLVDGK